MGKSSYNKTYVKIEITYPHNLLMHLNGLIGGNVSMMRNRDAFLDMYKEKYKDDSNEMLLLELAYDKDIIKGFFGCFNEAEWRKRVFVRTVVYVLTEYVEEKYAVLLVESLMFVFGFDFKLVIERKWEAKESERANFHEKTEFTPKSQRGILGQIKIKEGNGKLQTGKFSGTNVKKEVYFSENNNEDDYDTDEINVSDITEKENRMPEAGNGREKQDTFSRDKEKNSNKRLVTEEKYLQHVKFYDQMSLPDRRTLEKAFQGNAQSQCEMGNYYSDKNTDHADYNEAIKWYSLSADNGYERAFFELAQLYDQNSYEIPDGKQKALKIYNDMANQGFPTAQRVLGMKYWFGDGVEVDIKKAAAWFEKAAVQHHENAIKNLADLYYSIHDTENARKWYRIGANAGDPYCKEKLRQVGR